MTMTNHESGNRVIAEFGGYKLITEFPPNVYQKGNKRLTSISFHKPKMFGELMNLVDYLEQKYDLYIAVKRKQCIIQKMHLTSNRTIVNIEGKSKQDAVWLAVVDFINWYKQKL